MKYIGYQKHDYFFVPFGNLGCDGYVLCTMSLDPDQPYIEKTLKGDAKAFSVLVDRYKHMVFTLVLRITNNREDAEEVAQDTFVRAYMRLPQFKGDSKFSTWIYKIAYHGGLDVLKKQKRRKETVSIEDCKLQYLGDGGQEANQLEVLERQRTVRNAIQQLPTEDSLIITLFYYEEQSLEEISKIMELSANTLKVRLFRVRKKLEVILNNLTESQKR